MGGTYTIRWWTTFEGGSNLELQRMASQLHNERIRLERITRRSAYLLGFLRDIEINILETKEKVYRGLYSKDI